MVIVRTVSVQQEIQALVVRLEVEMEASGDTWTQAMLAWRELGAKGVRSSDLPSGWSKSRREHHVWAAGLFAEVPYEEFDAWIGSAVRRQDFSYTKLRSKAERRRAARLKAERERGGLSVKGCELYEADIFKVSSLRLGEAAAVITDPPYEAQALPLWSELFRFAGDVLMDRGWLVAMSGQRWLPEVVNTFGLRYCWTMCVSTPGAEAAQGWISPRNPLNTYWKPVFVFSKGEPTEWPAGLSDVLVSDANDKRYHRWGQSQAVFETLVSAFAEPGQLVADPFLGGGTTAAASVAVGRAVEGFDIDPQEVAGSRKRLEEE